MAKWSHELNITDLWAEATARAISCQDFVIQLIVEIRKLQCEFGINSNGWQCLDLIIDEFEGFGVEEDFDDFDAVWETFYDFADTFRVWVKK